MAETAKHTPGPWVVEQDVNGCKNIYAQQLGEDGGVFAVTELGYTHGRADEDEDVANAALIAAAPEQNKALVQIACVANFGEEDGAMELGDRLIEIEPVSYTHLTLPTILLV